MTNYRLNCERGETKVAGHPVALTVSGDPDAAGGRRVEGVTHSGASITSWVDADGRFRSTVVGPLEGGRDAEWHALKVFQKALGSQGIPSVEIHGAQDDRGEDRLIVIGGRKHVVQTVSVPADPSVWRSIAEEGAVLEGDLLDAVQFVRTSIERKLHHASDSILLLEASALGAVLGPRLVDAYVERFGDPESELGAAQVWIVGRTGRDVLRVGGRADEVDGGSA